MALPDITDNAAMSPDITKLPGYVDPAPMQAEAKREREIGTEGADRENAAKQAELAPIYAQMEKLARADTTAITDRRMPLPPQPDTKAGIDPAIFKSFFQTSLIMTAFLGKAMKVNMYDGMAALDGAVRGYTLGNKELGDEKAAIFKQKMEYIKANNEQVDQDLRMLINAPLEQKQSLAAIIGAKHDLPLVRYQSHIARADELDKTALQTIKNNSTLGEKHEAVWASLESKREAMRQHKEIADMMHQDRVAANAPAKADESMGAQAATGMPLTQIIPGYGKGAVAQRVAARQEAINQIKQTLGVDDKQAGIELANRTIEYQSGKRSSGQLTTMLGATRQAVEQLDLNIDNAKKEMAKLKSTNLLPVLNAIVRGEEKWTGDPAYSSLFYYMAAVGQESARILSGGQASIAQLHEGAQEEARKWISIGMTPASANSVFDAMHQEGNQRLQTYEHAIEGAKMGKRPAQAGAGRQKLPAGTHLQPGPHKDKNGNKFTVFPDGTYE